MIERLLRWFSIGASLLVIFGFAGFVLDEGERGSEEQLRALGDPRGADPTPRGEIERERANGPVREVIDDANDILLKPFANLVDSDNRWVARLVPTVLALLIYGFGAAFLANAARKLP